MLSPMPGTHKALKYVFVLEWKMNKDFNALQLHSQQMGFPYQWVTPVNSNHLSHPEKNKCQNDSYRKRKKKIWHLYKIFKIFIIIQLQLSAFSSHPSTPAQPNPPPRLYPPPWFCPGVLYSTSCKPLSPLSPPHSPLAIVRLPIYNSQVLEAT